jgi:hypothetical protein
MCSATSGGIARVAEASWPLATTPLGLWPGAAGVGVAAACTFFTSATVTPANGPRPSIARYASVARLTVWETVTPSL